MEDYCVNKGHDVFFVAAKIPDVKTAQGSAEDVNCLSRENTFQKQLNDDFLAALALNFLKLLDDINDRLKSSDSKAVENHATKKSRENLLFLRDEAEKEHFHGFFDKPLE